MEWFKGTPTKEGWYFWRNTSVRSDPLLWKAVYIEECDDGHVDFWMDGTNYNTPIKGQWRLIELTKFDN